VSAAELSPKQRAAQMRQKRAAGWTYAKIAQHYGISRQRVHTIVNRLGKA
jgi:DNA-directed RNA polymerase specialized sigma24 family protein